MYTMLYVTVTPFDHLLVNFEIVENAKAVGRQLRLVAQAGAHLTSLASQLLVQLMLQ